MSNRDPIATTTSELSMKISHQVCNETVPSILTLIVACIQLPVMRYNFEKYNDSFVDTLNTPYDYSSVMHYGSDAFSENGRATIEPLLSNVTIGQRENLSSIDIQEVRLLYNCSASGVTLGPISNITTSKSTSHLVDSRGSYRYHTPCTSLLSHTF
jgi:hypothetical protein